MDLAKLKIIYEDNHLIAVNKPAGMLVQGDETGDMPLSEYVKDYIKIQYNKPGAVFLGVVHRLDRPVSGALIFARTSKALERMNELFREQQVEKTYLAITRNRPDPLEGKLVNYLYKDTEKNVVKALDAPSNRHKEARYAELDYELIGDMDAHFLLRVHPKTGRPHQIRAQLSKMGCPIKGDLKYRATEANHDGSISLHCLSMRFLHPVKKEWITIRAEPPATEWWRKFKPFWKESEDF